MPRLAVARLWFEGNRFSPRPTTLADFVLREWRRGDEALEAARGTETELAAVLDFAAAHPDWTICALRCASASPGGPIADEVFEPLLQELIDELRAQRPDAVYLSLHGAAISASRDAPELDLLRAVRTAIGRTPMVASFDLHANLNPEVCSLLDFATGYRTYPHVDMRQTARRALDALEAMMTGKMALAGHLVRLDRVLPSFNMRTDDEPMRSLQALARAGSTDGVVDISLFGGFPYSDTADTGASVMAWSTTGSASGAATETLASAMLAQAACFDAVLTPPATAIEAALAVPAGLAAVTDPADNPLSGGAADTPALFRVLLNERLDPTSATHRLPAGSIVFAYFADPGAVAAARKAGIGACIELALGGRATQAFGDPVPVRATVLEFSDGCFVNTGPMERGATVQVGRTVLLDVEGIRVIVCESVGAANDPAFFALHGIDLATTRLLCVKAKNHFRAAFAPLCARIVDADCPGPAAADLSTLPFTRARLTSEPPVAQR